MPFKHRSKLHNPPAVTRQRGRMIRQFEKQLGVRFRDAELLNLALCHRSFSNEENINTSNNEKLEFLGDSVLGMIVSEYLYIALSEKSEGDLAKIKSFVVSESILAEIASKIRIQDYVLIGKGEESSGGRTKKAILADAMEAVIGAYFLDSGLKKSRKFILQLLIPEINRVLENKHQKDYKTLLQELVQKRFKTYPRYRIVEKNGPDHDKTFLMEVVINRHPYGRGKGKNKKEAEQVAAQIAYESIWEKKPRHGKRRPGGSR